MMDQMINTYAEVRTMPILSYYFCLLPFLQIYISNQAHFSQACFLNSAQLISKE